MIRRPPALRRTLASGLRLVARSGVRAPVTAVSVFLPAGWRHDPPGMTGLAHFAVSALRRGAGGLSARALARETDATGCDLSLSAAADYTTLGMKTLTRHLDRSLALLATLLSPDFPDTQMRALRREIAEEIRADHDDMAAVADRAARREALAGTPYARGRLGTLAEARAVRPDDLRAFWYGRAIDPARILVSCVSSLPAEAALDRLEAALAPLAGPSGAPPEPPPPAAAAPRRAARELARDRDQLALQFSFPAPAVRDPDHPAAVLLATVLGDGLGFRLGRLRESTGLAYVIYAHYESYLESGHFKVALGTSPDRRRFALARLEETFADLARRPVDAAELALARARAVGSLVQSFETSRERAHYDGYFEAFLGDGERYASLIADVGALSAEALRDCARRLFEGPRALALVGRKETR